MVPLAGSSLIYQIDVSAFLSMVVRYLLWRQIFDRGISMLALFQRRIFADRNLTVLLLLKGIQYIEGIEIGPELISERKVELQYMCGKT